MIIKKPGTSVDLPNREVLIKFGEANGSPTFNGKPIGSIGSNQNQAVLDSLSDIGGVLGYKGMPVGGGGSSGSGSSNLIIGGDVRFSVDFIAKTIAFTTWNLFASNKVFTLVAGSKSFTEMGSTTFYYVCYKSNTIELVTIANIASYNGYVLFGIMGTTVYPLSYPVHQIGVRGGATFSRKDVSIGEWTLIGDSITFGGGQSFVPETLPVPIITNLAVNGRRMSGSGGMWTTKDTVTATTELCTIMGGTNDQGSNVTIGEIAVVGSTFDTNTFIGAYQTLIEGLLTKNPKMVIILITPSRAWTDNSGVTERVSMKTYVEAVKSVGGFYGVPVVDLYNNMGLNKLTQSTYLSDGLHPNDLGKRRISAMVAAAIRSNWAQVN